MNRHQIRALLDEVRDGALTPEAAHDRLLQVLRHAPFEDLGFARIDHHRSTRQGFPEVVFGPGKSAEQVAVIADRIVTAGHSLLVTRTTRGVFDAVATRVPGVQFHELARAITLKGPDVHPGRGTIVFAAAGTADLPVAEEAGVSA
jgi:NCAIR mutase (PurE)-related protein